MVKTTLNNPASLQKYTQSHFRTIVRKFVHKLFDGQFKASQNYLYSEYLNYVASFKNENQFYCNLCKLESPFFFHTSNKQSILFNSICPNCSSRKRHRGLYELYKNILTNFDNPNILHFAPEPVFYSLFKKYQYVTADKNLSDVDLNLDIQMIACDSNQYNLVLCNHVLEHIENDSIAIKELHRILKPSGILILTVPGNWNRLEIIQFEKVDANGHLREYGLDLIMVLKSLFREVECEDLIKYNNTYQLPLGLTSKHDLVFVCKK
jgi:SAM-dependent methyltransferase